MYVLGCSFGVPTTYKPAHEIVVLIAHLQMPLITTYANVSNEAKCLNFGPDLRLFPLFVYASIEHSLFADAVSTKSAYAYIYPYDLHEK